jgi:hypothetical protein
MHQARQASNARCANGSRSTLASKNKAYATRPNCLRQKCLRLGIQRVQERLDPTIFPHAHFKHAYEHLEIFDRHFCRGVHVLYLTFIKPSSMKLIMVNAKRPNGLASSCHKRARRSLQNATDLAREAVCCNRPSDTPYVGMSGTPFGYGSKGGVPEQCQVGPQFRITIRLRWA